MHYPMDDEDRKKQEEAMKKTLKKASEGSDSELLKRVSAEEANMNEPSVQANCEILWKLTEETKEIYKNGEKSFEEAIDGLIQALKGLKGANMNYQETYGRTKQAKQSPAIGDEMSE